MSLISEDSYNLALKRQCDFSTEIDNTGRKFLQKTVTFISNFMFSNIWSKFWHLYCVLGLQKWLKGIKEFIGDLL